MGLRFRKSVKLGPFRINFSKSGVGYSYGVKGYRVTHKAGGGVRKTASIPGTGISYVTESSSKKAAAKPAAPTDDKIQEAKTMTARPEGRYIEMTGKDGKPYYIQYIRCPYCGKEVLETSIKCPFCNKKLNAAPKSSGGLGKKIGAAALAGVVALGGIGMFGGDDEPAPTPAPDPAPIVQPVDPAPVPEPEPVVDEAPVIAEPEPAPEPATPGKSPAVAPDPTPAPAPVTPESAPEPEPVPEQSEQVEIVYVLNTNTKKFHEPDCSSVEDILPKNYDEMSGRDKIISQGYKPCGRCKP